MCLQGHIACVHCYKKMIPTQPQESPECGICRAPINGRNTFAEGIMDFVLQTTILDCRNKPLGCRVSNFGASLTKHEEHECPYREVSCPASFQRTCHRKCSFKEIDVHMISANCCINRFPIMDNQNWEVWSIIFGNTRSPVELYQGYNRCYWTPSILVSRHFRQYLPYLGALRSLSGNWYFFVNAYASKEVIDSIPCRIIVKTACRGPVETVDRRRVFIYEGHMSQHLDDNRNELAIMQSGRYLTLRDDQVKQLTWTNEEMLQIYVQLGKTYDAGPELERLLEIV